MAAFPFELVSPERLLISADVEAVQLPGSEGEFEVMANHAPLLAMLGPGVITITGGDVPHRKLFVDGGFCDVNQAGCTVLAEAAIAVHSSSRSEIDALIASAEEETGALEPGPTLDEQMRRLTALRAARDAFPG